jgi:hypothetical protein
MSLTTAMGRFIRFYKKPFCNSRWAIFLCRHAVCQTLLATVVPRRNLREWFASGSTGIVRSFFMSIPLIRSSLEKSPSVPPSALLKITFSAGSIGKNPEKCVDIVRLLPLIPGDKLLTFEIAEVPGHSLNQGISFEKLSFSALFGDLPPAEGELQDTTGTERSATEHPECPVLVVPPFYSSGARSFIKSYPPGSCFVSVSLMKDTDPDQNIIPDTGYECFLTTLLEFCPNIYIVVFDPGFDCTRGTCRNPRILHAKQYGWSLIQEMAVIAGSDIFIGNNNLYGAAAQQFGACGLIFFENRDLWYKVHGPDHSPFKQGIGLNKDELTGIICSMCGK